MATLTATLTLVSSDATSDPINLVVPDVLTVGEPIQSISRALVTFGAATNILTTANTADTYVYVKNTDATNFVEGKDDAGNVLIQLNPGEFAFLPIQGAIGFEVQADTGNCIVEYGFWTKA